MYLYHGDSFRSEDFRDRQGGVERNVGEDVDEGHQDAGDGDGFWKVPVEISVAIKLIFPIPCTCQMRRLGFFLLQLFLPAGKAELLNN